MFYWKGSRCIIQDHGISLLSLENIQNVNKNLVRHQQKCQGWRERIPWYFTCCAVLHVCNIHCLFTLFSHSFVSCSAFWNGIEMCCMCGFELKNVFPQAVGETVKILLDLILYLILYKCWVITLLLTVNTPFFNIMKNRWWCCHRHIVKIISHVDNIIFYYP